MGLTDLVLVKTFCDRQKSTAQHPLPPAPNLGATGKESEAVCRYTLRPAHEWVITQMTLMVGFGVYLTLLAMVRAIPPVHPPSMLNPVSEEELEFSAKINPSPPTPTPPPKPLSYPPQGRVGGETLCEGAGRAVVGNFGRLV